MDVRRLRKWFAVAAVAVVAVVAAFYFYAQLRLRRAIQEAPRKLGVQVQQSTEGFTLSKSEAGRTLFTIHASKAVQYKEGGRAQLHEVSIIVYGRESDRFDQISGSDFEYDPQSGDVTAHGEVHIDLQSNAQGPARPDQAIPPELKNPVHLKTSGLSFNHKTGLAATRERIEFRIPQASGSAMGATYDVKGNVLALDSSVRVQTVQGATILARHGVVTRDPRRAVLSEVRVERPGGDFEADKLTAFLRDDNSIERMLAAGNVRGTTGGATPGKVRAPQAEFFMSPKDTVRSAVLSGGVSFEQVGASPWHGTAGRATLEFAAGNVLSRIKATDAVKLTQDQAAARERPSQSLDLIAEAVDIFMRKGQIERAQTRKASQITLRPQQPGPPKSETTVITAGRFDATFGPQNRIKTLRGAPNAKIVSSLPGQPDKVSTSRELDAVFSGTGGAIASLTQQGDVQYADGLRTASAGKALYTPGDENLVLTGSPRVVERGLTTTARLLRLNRRSGDAAADGDVRTTYNEVQPQPGGALLATADPIHVTANSMTAHRDTGMARYTGSARLWQATNIIEAPTIELDRERRNMVAQAGRGQRVSTVFVQTDKKGKVTPVNVTAAGLTYSDAQRKARFEGGVVLKGADATMTADHADVWLLPRGQKSAPGPAAGGNQVEQIVAEGHVAIQEPSRKATGERLVYTAADGKFVLTGGPPSIFDAEHGTTTGDSLTFFSRDDRVRVGSENSTRTVTQTRVNK